MEKRNVQENTYKAKTKSGDIITEKISTNKDTGEVTRKAFDKNGKNLVEEKKEQGKIQVTNENAALVQVQLLNEIVKRLNVLPNILNQLIEMNYYMAHLEPEEARDQNKINEHFEKLGIQLRELNG
jgi:hypothetical protein